MLVKIEDIKVNGRVRKDLGNLETLKQSLKTYGLLNPISINKDYELIAGERRLTAAKELGWETINATVLGNLTKIQELEIELEENNSRKSFTQDELVEGFKKLEKLKNPSFWEKIKLKIKKMIQKIKKIFGK